MKRVLAALAVTAAVAAAEPGSKEVEAARQRLEELVKAPSRSQGGTIGFEKAVLALKDLKAARELAGFLKVTPAPTFMFRAEILWALSEIGDASVMPAVVEALRGDAELRAWAPSFAAGFRSAELLPVLKELAAARPDDAQLRGALVACGDTATAEAIAAELRGTDAQRRAAAALALGHARDGRRLKDLLPLLEDGARVEGLRSAFAVKVETRRPDGSMSSRTGSPELATVADAAIEAANLAFRSTTPEHMAWWLEKDSAVVLDEKKDADGSVTKTVGVKTRFGAGVAAVAAIREYCKSLK